MEGSKILIAAVVEEVGFTHRQSVSFILSETATTSTYLILSIIYLIDETLHTSVRYSKQGSPLETAPQASLARGRAWGGVKETACDWAQARKLMRLLAKDTP